jgi:hypothetical protein
MRLTGLTDMADPKTNVLILTATIAPPTGAIKLARTDPTMRLSDYRKAFGSKSDKVKQSDI